MRLLIAEQAHVGHYYAYARYLIEAAHSTGAEVIFAVTPEGLRSDEFQTHLSRLPPRLKVRPILRVARSDPLRQIIDNVANIRHVVMQERPDALFVPTADGMAQSVGLAAMVGLSPIPRHVHAECLVNRLSFTYPQYTSRTAIAISLAALRKSPWSTIHVTDMLAYERLTRNGGKLRDRLRIIPDPVEDGPARSKQEARQALGIPQEGRYFACIGVIDSRKGIAALAKAFATAALEPSDRLLLAGKVDQETTALLAAPEYGALRRSGRLVVLDRLLSASEYLEAVVAANVVCCTYPRQPHPMSLAIKALAAGRPVLGADNFWIGPMARRFQMGWTVNVADAAAFATILPRCLNEAASWRISERGRRLVQFSAADNFKACWLQGLREKMGLPADKNILAWEWVTAAEC